MKDTLIEYNTIIFDILHLKSIFEVYECNKNELSLWARKLDGFHSYLVICQLNLFDKKNIETGIIKSLKHKDWYCWFDNNSFLTPPVSEFCLPENLYFLTPVHSPKNIIIPDWIDTYLFNNLNTKYAPDYT